MLHVYILPFMVMNYMMAIGCWSLYHNPPDRITIGSLVGVVCFVSAVCGMFGALEKAVAVVDGKSIIWCKYLEYSLNTPLLTAIMCESYGVDANKTMRLTSLTASYCLCGLGAVLTTRVWLRWYFVVVSLLTCAWVSFKLLQVAQSPPCESRVARLNVYMMMISYPLVVVCWGLSDIFMVIDHRQQFFLETMLMVAIKTTALLYVLGDREWLTLSNCIWEAPGHVFYVARSVLFNRH
jgi:bacteriorhodopsin